MIYILCRPRELQTIVDEYGDWKGDGLQVRLYGHTLKAKDGFLLLEWSQPVPEVFLSKLKDDQDIFDYLTYEVPPQPAQSA